MMGLLPNGKPSSPEDGERASSGNLPMFATLFRKRFGE
jgi:hypothetical protein